jgi:hypothetical protein
MDTVFRVAARSIDRLRKRLRKICLAMPRRLGRQAVVVPTRPVPGEAGEP